MRRLHLYIPIRPIQLLAGVAAVAGCTPPKATPPDEVLPETVKAPFTAGQLFPEFGHANSVWAGVALLDHDQDGWLDIFLTNGRNHPDALYRNLGDGTFEDVGSEAGIASLEESGSVVSGDIDNDGDPDLVVGRSCSVGTLSDTGSLAMDGGKSVYINQGDGTFEEYPIEGVGWDYPVDSCVTSMELFDIDVDGDLDLVMANGGDPDVETPWQFRKNIQPYTLNWVALNEGNGEFLEQHKLPHIARISFAIASFDIDGDGRNDLLSGDAGYQISRLIAGADNTWEWDREDNIGTGDGLWMGLAVADYDRDGDLDIYGTNQGLSTFIAGYDNISTVESHITIEGEFINTHHSLLLNEDGNFAPAEDWPVWADHLLAGDLFDGLDGTLDEYMEPEGLERYAWGWGAVPIDYDSDGWVDVAFIGNNCSMPLDVIWNEERGAGPGALLRNLEGEGFADLTWEVGVPNLDDDGRYQDGRGIAMGDLNNDGFPDLVYTSRSYNPTLSDPLAQVTGQPRVWLSQERDAHWLQIELEGTLSNRDGIGSTVWVRAGDEEWIYVLGAGGGTNSTSERVVFAGLGDIDEVDIEVQFPSGIVVVETAVAADQRIVLEEH
jgi:hypothetical protein